MDLAWYANGVTVPRLGDAYGGCLLKGAARVSFAVTLGTVLAERFLDLATLALLLAATVAVAARDALPPEGTRVLAGGLAVTPPVQAG